MPAFKPFPQWVPIASIALGFITFISLFLPWQKASADLGMGLDFSGSVSAFSDQGRTMFPAVMILLTSIALIAIGVVVLLNAAPQFNRFVPLGIIIAGGINLFMLLLVFTFLNVKAALKAEMKKFGDIPDFNEVFDELGIKASFHVGVWITLIVSLAIIGVGVFALIQSKKFAPGPGAPAMPGGPMGGPMAGPMGGPGPQGQQPPQGPQGPQGPQPPHGQQGPPASQG